MTIKKLKQLLNGLDDTWEVSGNELGNLIIYKDGVYIGYLDFTSELFELEESNDDLATQRRD